MSGGSRHAIGIYPFDVEGAAVDNSAQSNLVVNPRPLIVAWPRKSETAATPRLALNGFTFTFSTSDGSISSEAGRLPPSDSNLCRGELATLWRTAN
jgi:hydrogenase expression/formation protein HypC